MTKQELSRHFWLIHEIKRQESRLKRLEKKMEALADGETVGDTVRDYRTGKGIPVRIEGIPEEGFTLPIIIKLLKGEIVQNIRESEEEAVKIEQYIKTIADPRLRELLRCRFIDCMGWEEIGAENYMHRDTARKIIENFLKRGEQVDKKCKKNKSHPF